MSGILQTPRNFAGKRAQAWDELFGLRVHGDSMRDAGILDGDLVLVRRQPRAHTGEIVVALVGDEATVKRLRMRGRRVELHPENPDYEPIVPHPRDVTLLGKVIEVPGTKEVRHENPKSI